MTTIRHIIVASTRPYLNNELPHRLDLPLPSYETLHLTVDYQHIFHARDETPAKMEDLHFPGERLTAVPIPMKQGDSIHNNYIAKTHHRILPRFPAGIRSPGYNSQMIPWRGV